MVVLPEPACSSYSKYRLPGIKCSIMLYVPIMWTRTRTKIWTRIRTRTRQKPHQEQEREQENGRDSEQEQ